MARAGGTALRSDAVRSRQAILEAARELFAVSADVPMYEIAKRAGVGQATLYRHFPDRIALALSLSEEFVVDLETLAREHADDPGAFRVLLSAVVDSMVTFHGLVEIMRRAQVAPTAESPMRERYIGLFDGPLRRARAAGAVRDDFRVDEIPVLFAMISGGLGEVAEPVERPVVAERMIQIVLRGIAPSGTRGIGQPTRSSECRGDAR